MCDAVLVEPTGLVTSDLAAVIAISDDGGLRLVKFTSGAKLQILAAPIVPAVIAGSVEAGRGPRSIPRNPRLPPAHSLLPWLEKIDQLACLLY